MDIDSQANQTEALSQRDMNILIDRALNRGGFDALELANLTYEGGFDAMVDALDARIDVVIEGDESTLLSKARGLYAARLEEQITPVYDENYTVESNVASQARQSNTRSYAEGHDFSGREELIAKSESHNKLFLSLLSMRDQVFQESTRVRGEAWDAFEAIIRDEYPVEVSSQINYLDEDEEESLPTRENWGVMGVKINGPWDLNRALTFVRENANLIEAINAEINKEDDVLAEERSEELRGKNIRVRVSSGKPFFPEGVDGAAVTPERCFAHARELQEKLNDISGNLPNGVTIFIGASYDLPTKAFSSVGIDATKSTADNINFLLANLDKLSQFEEAA